MSQIAIQTRGLGKRYRLRASEPYDTLRDRLASLPKRMIGAASQLAAGRSAPRAPDFWALRDVDIDIPEGQVVGVIGRNGAGKSTLLKVLSRITRPTAGEATVYGRVGSLLEVGTGFHLELTGRENVMVNGAILGMGRAEIMRKFDEIVEFAGVDRFIDTPVKHYSSGMRLRLAFAVAAHLDAEILIIDEVLAVGDAAFQRRCFERMNDVANRGRTVLVVSHQMEAIETLCSRTIWIDAGRVAEDGATGDVIRDYLVSALSVPDGTEIADRTDRLGDGPLRFTSFSIVDPTGAPQPAITTGKNVRLRVGYTSNLSELQNVEIAIWIRDQFGKPLICCYTLMKHSNFRSLPQQGFVECMIVGFPLVPGHYRVDLNSAVKGSRSDKVADAATVQVVAGDFFGTGFPVDRYGTIVVDHEWSFSGAAASSNSGAVAGRSAG
jgi:lipopolysaccharide transport system ATP-binding protein